MALATTATFSSTFSGLYGSSSSASSTSTPHVLEVAINGHPYRIDTGITKSGRGMQAFQRNSVPALRQQSDQGPTPGEQSISRDDLWRRTQSSWHHGAGQTYFDRPDSDAAMFASSKGVDVWSRWKLRLLGDVQLAKASTSPNLRLTTAGDWTYLTDGVRLLRTTTPLDGASYVEVTSTPGTAADWVTTDGYSVWSAHGEQGIFVTTRDATTASSYTGLPTSLLGYVKGRLMAAYGPSIYNVTASGAGPAPLLTQGNVDFRWVAFAEGPGHIYAAGFSGNRSLIYRTAIAPDGTQLQVPSVAGELPTDETVTTIKGYLGFLLIGSTLGVRLASIDGQGNLTLGALIRTPAAVRNFEPTDRFVWFGWSNYDSTSTGLGRLDLSTFTAPLLPAYASDLMAAAQGEVLSISTSGTKRLFTVAGVGLFRERDERVAEGVLTSSRITYDISDDKVARFCDLRTSPLAGSIAVSISTDSNATREMGTFAAVGQTRPPAPLNAGQARGEFFEVRLALRRSVVAPATGPEVTRFTLRSYPAPTRSFVFTVPVLLFESVEDRGGESVRMDPFAERDYLESLLRSQQLVTYQEGDQSYTVLVDDIAWFSHSETDDRHAYNGTMVLNLKEQVA